VQHAFNGDAQEMRLIETEPYVQRWASQQDLLDMLRRGEHFMDVTDHADLGMPSFMDTTSTVGTFLLDKSRN
jgi:hypothetical protein